MTGVRVEGVRQERRADGFELAATLWIEDAKRRIWLRTDRPPVTASANPFLATALLPAQRLGLPLRIEGAVSPRVLRGAERVQQVFSVWGRGAPIVPIEVERTEPSPASAGGVAAFFTGGVDSFHTVETHRGEISHLVFVHGFDIKLQRTAFRAEVSRALRRSAAELGCELVEVETNLRGFGNRQVRWAEDQHGAALAAVALYLEPRFRRIYVPSSYSDAFLFPSGSHPGLDRHWSSEALEIVHDDCGLTRFEKIEALASSEPALRALRVCWQFESEAYNCCRCVKCVWTMAYLRACGALERTKTFPLPLDLELLAQMPFMHADEHMRMLQALGAIERRGGDPELARAFSAAIAAGIRSAAPVPAAGRLRRLFDRLRR